MKIGIGGFNWGSKPPEEKPQPNPQTILHEPQYIVMKIGTGELTNLDQAYLSDNLEEMLVDEALQEAWSRVHIGQPVFRYRTQLKAQAAEWRRTHPTFNEEPYYVLNDLYVVVPTASGVQIYEVKKVKDKGLPTETVELGSQTPWMVAPASAKKADILLLISNQFRDDKIVAENQKIREILGGKDK